jgi:hypothetical protein
VGSLGDPVSEKPLRRPIPSPYVDRELPAEAVAANARHEAPTGLDLASRELAESGQSATEAYRRLHRARLLVLAEPHMTDLLCFAVDPRHYRGIILPVFTSGRTLGEALERHPSWASRTVLEIGADQLRTTLGTGETAVVNPWTAYEFRLTSTEHGYGPSLEVASSIDAPTSSSRAVSSS